MLKEQIKNDVKEAMKAKDRELVGVLRMALSAIAAKEMEKRYKLAKENPSKSEEDLVKEMAFGDEEIIDTIGTEIKKHRDSIALYEQGGRLELAETEKKEITILQKYLPAQLSEDELKKLIESAIAKTGAKEMKDMGKVMAELMPSIKGKAETSQVSNSIKKIING